jgi:hypothetical protein
MLADDQRWPAALDYLQQISSEPGPGFIAKLRDFSSELGQKCKARGSSLTNEQASKLAADCEGFVHVAYGRHSDSLDFYPPMNAWLEAMSNVPQTPIIVEARKNVDHWFELYPRTAASTPSPAVAR